MDLKRILALSFIIILLLGLTNCSAKPHTEEAVAKGESNIKTYISPDGWAVDYPASWNQVEQNFIQEESTGKHISFDVQSCDEVELKQWIDSEIQRKLAATEAGNTIAQPLKQEQIGKFSYYTYIIKSKMESSEYLLKNTIIFDGKRRYAFSVCIPPITEKEYDEIIKSFRVTN